MTVKTEISLDSFFIFNPTLGIKEGEEEKKILYYYPKSTDLKTKVRNIGLSEAIFNFTRTFNPDQPCEVLNTRKIRQIYYNPEPNIYLVLVLKVPFCRTVDGDVEYQSDHIQTDIYLSVLKQMYRECVLFTSTFSYLSRSQLAMRLDTFYEKYLPTLRIQNCDIMDLFQGIHFLPLDKGTFLHIHSCINLMQAMFPFIEYSMFLCNEQLVWSGLDMEDTQLVFRYLVSNILYPLLDSETIQSKEGSALPRISSSTNNYGRFLTGATNLDSNLELETPPIVHLHHHTGLEEKYYFVIYNALSITVCLFIPVETNTLSLDTYKRLDVFLSPKLTSLASQVSSYTSNANSSLDNGSSSGPKFIYFNQLNLAMKSSIHTNYRKSNNNISIDPNVMRILMDIKSASKHDLSSTGETIVKTVNDYWVIGKYSNSREFYIVIQHKNANLIEINDEVKKICDSQLENIFFCQ
uniref:Vacuolar fusion protein CCZ1 homolog n=1 Tax=Cacopsylla melanoneura TaxID=428564 RepID=A0A8D8YMP1_9HEMI